MTEEQKIINIDDKQTDVSKAQAAPSANLKSIFAKIANIMSKMESISKNASNDFHKYKYASADAVFDACRKLMADEHLVIIPRMEHVHQEGASTNIDFVFTLCCAKTGATLDVAWSGEATDKGDKGINKCATTALKYFLMKLFVIDTGNPENDADAGEGSKSKGNSNQTAAPQGPLTFPISKITVARQKKKPDQQMYVVKGSKKSAYMFTSEPFAKAGYDTSDWKLSDGEEEKEVALDPAALVTVITDDKGYLQVTAVEQHKPAQPKGATSGNSKPNSTSKSKSTTTSKSSSTGKKSRPKTLQHEIVEFDFDGTYGLVAVEEHDATIVIENPVTLFEEIVEQWPEDAAPDNPVTVELMIEANLTCKSKITKDKASGEILGHYVVTDAT